ncbi:dolichol phosphate-mannose biosynthesis regulatory [Paraphysoderma sedebokerense]|nr:dolichol phosphate-mannose biosynthesis regulatory [Paraphysoderma sedebokerense]
MMPFVDEGHPLHGFFPPREYAIKIPVVLLIIGVSVISAFISLVMIKSNLKKRQKEAKKSN